MTLKLVSDAGTDPVSLAEARQWCNVDDGFTDHDGLLLDLITTMRVHAEFKCNRSFLSTTWDRVWDGFPPAEMEVGEQPVQSIVSITYLDADRVLQTLDPAAYVLDDVTNPAMVLPAADTAWPATANPINAVRIRFVQGWASASNPLCKPLRLWMRMHIAAAYAQREAFAIGVTVTELPGRFVESLLDSYIVPAI
jgi:uncharacterized phiE125 gp8 family phage protein